MDQFTTSGYYQCKYQRAQVRSLIIFFLFLISSTIGLAQNGPDIPTIDPGLWQTQQLAPGLTWKYRHFDTLFHSRQSINILDVDPDYPLNIEVAHLDSGLEKTSLIGQQRKALAAVNGTYFNMKKGGSVCLLMADSRIISLPDSGLSAQHGNGAITIDQARKASIIPRPEEGWKTMKDFQDVMSSGPLLLLNGSYTKLVEDKFNQNRHPRTAVGITQDGHVLFVTADGRNAQAAGLSTPELAMIMKSLGCRDALNLDGGGSTSMWTARNGVVNFPSDNKRFDHEGERKVANALIIR